MRQRGRITAMAMLAALAWPGAAAAQDAFIRIEAKRGAAADAAAEGWRARFPDVVTVTLANGMTGIVLGPQTPAEAAARMARLKAEGAIPADSYLTGPGGEAPLAGMAEALAAAEATAAGGVPGREGEAASGDAPGESGPAATSETLGGEPPEGGTALPAGDGPAGASDAAEGAAASMGEMAPETAAAERDQVSAAADASLDSDEAGAAADDGEAGRNGETASLPRDTAATVGAAGAAPAGLRGAMPDASPATPSDSGDGEAEAPVAAAPAAAAAPDASPRHIQLQATPGRVSAEAALAEWRRSFPQAQLWRLPGGWYAIALPAQRADRAEQRLAALKAVRRVPGDAFLATPGELGRLVEPQPGQAAGGAPAPDRGVPARAAGAGEGSADRAAATGSIAALPSIPDDPTAAATPVPAPPAPAVMPPILEAQRALRWAGRYDGALDGQTGPGTRAAIEAQIEATGGTATPAEAMAALIAEREDWRREMGLETLTDAATGLSLLAPVAKLAFDRTERALSIYGPKDGSGAALILFAQPGGQQEMEDLAGLVTALGWVPHPDRDMGRGRFTLTGANGSHIGHAEGRVQDGRAEGWVLIWPAADAGNARRLAVEAGESFNRAEPAASAEEAAARQ